MKAKKALKRLHRVETILTTVIDQYAARTRGLRGLLDTAKATVVRATEALSTAPSTVKKPPAKADQSRQRKVTTAKRNGAQSVARRSQRKSA